MLPLILEDLDLRPQVKPLCTAMITRKVTAVLNTMKYFGSARRRQYTKLFAKEKFCKSNPYTLKTITNDQRKRLSFIVFNEIKKKLYSIIKIGEKLF